MPTDLEILKPTLIVRQTNRFSLVQARVLNVLLHNAKEKLSKGQTHKIHVDELYKHLELDQRNEKALKEALKEIGRSVEWDIFSDDPTEWLIASLLPYAKFKNGYLVYKYCDELLEIFEYNLPFTLLSLEYQNKFKSKYSLFIWELCQSFRNIPTSNKSTGWLEVASFRKFLGIEEHEYKQFKIFNRDIIRKSIDEIREKSDILVDVEYRRCGRPIGELRFLFTLKDDVQEAPKFTQDERKPFNPAPQAPKVQESPKNPYNLPNELDPEAPKKARALIEKISANMIEPQKQGLTLKEQEELKKLRKEQNDTTA